MFGNYLEGLPSSLLVFYQLVRLVEGVRGVVVVFCGGELDGIRIGTLSKGRGTLEARSLPNLS